MTSRVALVLAVIALSAGVVVPSAGAATGGGSTPAGTVCASYLTGSFPTGITSQNFEPEFDAFDDVAADDLEVSRRCRARALTVIGTYYSGSGAASSETVTFYRDKDGWPGRVLSSETVVGADSQGSFEIELDRAVRLRPGHTYWLSVQANQDFGCCGQWGWAWRTGVDGNLAVWKNPGDGFGSGCVDWARTGDCFGEGFGDDLMFEVRTR